MGCRHLVVLVVALAAVSAAVWADAPPLFEQIPLCVAVGDGAEAAPYAARCRVVVWGERSSAKFPALRAADPSCKLLIYEAAANAVDGDGRTDPIGNKWIAENHPEWYLKDNKAQKIHFKSYPYLVAVDPGNPQYQQTWADNAIRIAKSLGADGVFMDNCNDRYDWNFGTPPANYPTQTKYAEAMDGFIRAVSVKFRAAGLLLVGNVSGQTWESGRLANWLELMDGFAIEPTPYGRDGTPQEVDGRWQKLFQSFKSHPEKMYLQYMPMPKESEKNRRYALACFLIWQGANSHATYCVLKGDPQPVLPLANSRIGRPTGEATNVSGTIYMRDYGNGVVYLNMSGSKPAAITLPPGLKNDRGAEMPPGPRMLGPHDSLILLKG